MDTGFEALYQDFRRLASRLKQNDGSWTLNPTALVHEAYLHLASSNPAGFESRDHLRNTVVLVMRRLLVDAARRRIAERRGGGQPVLSLDAAAESSAETGSVTPEELLNIHLALDKLAKENPIQARVFECHFFGGLAQTDIGELMGLPTKTVSSNLRLAKARLAVELAHGRDSEVAVSEVQGG